MNANPETEQYLEEYARQLEASAKGKWCLICGWQQPSPAWDGKNNTYKLRCDCPEGPTLVKRDTVAERMGQMVKEREMVLHEGKYREIAPAVSEQAPLTIETFKQRIELVKAVVAEMVEGVHYGIIPGTHDKSLWEPGAEYLRMAFGITWGYEMQMEQEDYGASDFHYKVRAFALGPEGAEIASWTASAWSRERKFFCKGGDRGCPNPCDQQHEPRGMEKAMLPHNTRDRAIKRGFVALIRNVTGTSGYFKQALDTSTEVGEAPADGSLPAEWPCQEPKCTGTMQLRSGSRGPYYSHKKGANWHNLDASKVREMIAAQPTTPATEASQDDAVAPLGGADLPEGLEASEGPETAPEENEQKALESYADLYNAVMKTWPSIKGKEAILKILNVDSEWEILDKDGKYGSLDKAFAYIEAAVKQSDLFG